jgi:hypothetical protein
MNAFKALLFAAILTVSSAASASDWPLYFDAIIKDRYILVILHEGGRAQYFDRMAQTDLKGHPIEDVFIQHDDDATWGSFPEEPKNKGVIPERLKNGKPVIYVRTNQFRFDYYFEEDRLTEFDKMGIQRILKRRNNTNQKPK